jgi:phage shock protein A
MEDTLVEVRTNAARTIADQKTMSRRLDRLRNERTEWEKRAELAINKNRDDLARTALAEKSAIAKVIDKLEDDTVYIEEQRQRLNEDIVKLQEKLGEAKARQKTSLMRGVTADSRLKTKDKLSDNRIDEAMTNLEHLEKKMDMMEGKADSWDMGQTGPVGEEFTELSIDESVEQELTELKRRMEQKRQAQSLTEK